jgi:hypothetical protein
MGTHLVRWPLEADEEVSSLFKSDPGNVELLRTMPLPDCAGITGCLVPSNIAGSRGSEFESKEFANLILSNIRNYSC